MLWSQLKKLWWKKRFVGETHTTFCVIVYDQYSHVNVTQFRCITCLIFPARSRDFLRARYLRDSCARQAAKDYAAVKSTRAKKSLFRELSNCAQNRPCSRHEG